MKSVVVYPLCLVFNAQNNNETPAKPPIFKTTGVADDSYGLDISPINSQR